MFIAVPDIQKKSWLLSKNEEIKMLGKIKKKKTTNLNPNG